MPDNAPGDVGFGEELKRNRLLREVSLESIAAATKISVRHLEALERGDFARLPAPVFTRGFIRAYADFLGLDPHEMVNAYLSEIGVPTAASAPVSKTSRGPSSRVTIIAILAAAVGVLIGAALWRRARRPHPIPPHPALLPPVSLSPHIRQVPPPSSATSAAAPGGGSAPARPAADPSAASSDVPAPSEPAGVAALGSTDALSLTIRFDADCWSRIFGDDRLLFSGTLRRGDERRFAASRSFRVTVGNAGAVRISINGRDLPPLGAAGEVVRDVRLDAERVNEILSRRG